MMDVDEVSEVNVGGGLPAEVEHNNPLQAQVADDFVQIKLSHQ